MANKDDYNV